MQALPEPFIADFYNRDTIIVAKALLGCLLWRKQDNSWRPWRIVETEAYTGNDPACHAYQRKTGRAAMLYAEPGTAYVYFTYGMHFCLNVVTEPVGVAGAVLIRALEPLPINPGEIISRPKQTPNLLRTDGPGRLARALGINQELFNGKPLTRTSHGLYISAGDKLENEQIITTTRIGITKGVDFPWRFYVLGSPWVSVRNKPAEAKR